MGFQLMKQSVKRGAPTDQNNLFLAGMDQGDQGLEKIGGVGEKGGLDALVCQIVR